MKLLVIAACLTLTQSTEHSHFGPSFVKIKNGGIITEESDHLTTANTLIKDKVSSVVKDYIAHKNLGTETGINAESVKQYLENHAADKIDQATSKIVTSYKSGGGNEIVISIPKIGEIPKITESMSTHTNDIKDNMKHNVKEYLENLRKDTIYADKSTVAGQEFIDDLKFQLTDNLMKGNGPDSLNEECTVTGKIKNRLPHIKTSVKEFKQDILGNYDIQDKLKAVKWPKELKYSEMYNLDEQALRKKLGDADLFIKKNLPNSKTKIIKRVKPLRKTILKSKKIKHFNDIKKAKIDLGKKYYKNEILTKSKPLKYDRLIRKKYKNLNKRLKIEKRYPKAKDYMNELIKTSRTLSGPDKKNLKVKLLGLKRMKKPKINFGNENIKIFPKEKLQKYYVPLREKQKLIVTDFELNEKLPKIITEVGHFQENLAEKNKLHILNDKLQHLRSMEKHKIHFDNNAIGEIIQDKIAPKYDELLIQQGYKTFLPHMPQFGALDCVPDHLKMAPSMRMPQLKHKLPSINLHKPHINLEPKFTPLDLSLNTEPLLVDIQMPTKEQLQLNTLKTKKKIEKKKIMKDLKKQKKLLEDYEDSLYLNEINWPGGAIYKNEPIGLLDITQNYDDDITDFGFPKSSDKLKYLKNEEAFDEYGILPENLIKLSDVSDAKDHIDINFKKLKNKANTDIHHALFNGNDIFKQDIHKLTDFEDYQDNIDTDFGRFKLKADKHAHFAVPDGSDILKGKIRKFKSHVEDTKDQLNNNLDRLKYEKTLSTSNAIHNFKEKKKHKLDDYVTEVEDNIDIDFDVLKNKAKQLALSKERDILKEKVHKLENNVEETKHHINNNLERIKLEKKLAISDKMNTLKEKKDQFNDYIKEAEENIDINLDKIKKNAKEQLALSDGSDIVKEKLHELENKVEKTKDRIDENLERLKFEKDLAISNGINILKEKKDKLNDYVNEAEESIDNKLDKLKNSAKQLAFTEESKILREKMHELENNREKTKYHIENNLEKLNHEKDLAVSHSHKSLKEKMHKLKDSVKDASDHISHDLEKLKHDSQKAAISYDKDVSKQHKYEMEDEQKEMHDHSKLSKLKHDVNRLVTSNEHTLKHKVDHLKNSIKNEHDDSSSSEKSQAHLLNESNVDEGTTSENNSVNQEKAGDGRKKIKQYTITRRRKKNSDKKAPVISQIPSDLENVNQEKASSK